MASREFTGPAHKFPRGPSFGARGTGRQAGVLFKQALTCTTNPALRDMHDPQQGLGKPGMW